MLKEVGFEAISRDYSKQMSSCSSGKIVSSKGELFLLVESPELSEKEKKLFERILKSLKRTNIKISKKKDLYFFLRNYCLENMLLLTKPQREKILQLLEWEALHNSILTPLLNDPELEEITINGPEKEVMVYHATFGWLKTNILFGSEEKIKNLVNKMASPLGRQISFHKPVVNAVLTDGSRLNASTKPVAFSGTNLTIRKFKEVPLTPLDLIKLKTISREAMAFLWLAMETSVSILICGNTGSGKTTTLNSLFCFLPQKERIIIAEETPELAPPQSHVVKMNTAEQVEIGLNELITNTFRMRPDRVIVGEVRNGEEAKAFIDTMLAGQAKGSYCTFHAESGAEAVERLLSFGAEAGSLASIDLIVVQKRQAKISSNGTRTEERKITEISEVLGAKKGVKINRVWALLAGKSQLSQIGKSKKVIEKIKDTFSVDEKGAKKLLKEKEKILKNLDGKISFKDFFELAQREC